MKAPYIPREQPKAADEGLGLPQFNPTRDVIVIPADFDQSKLSARARVALQMAGEAGKVVVIEKLHKPSVIRVN